jgi:hypothetical protein
MVGKPVLQSFGVSVRSAPCSTLHAPRSKLHADHLVIYQKVSTTNPSGGSSYGEIVKELSIIGGVHRQNESME